MSLVHNVIFSCNALLIQITTMFYKPWHGKFYYVILRNLSDDIKDDL